MAEDLVHRFDCVHSGGDLWLLVLREVLPAQGPLYLAKRPNDAFFDPVSSPPAHTATTPAAASASTLRHLVCRHARQIPVEEFDGHEKLLASSRCDDISKVSRS
jgi:hypothetical protein